MQFQKQLPLPPTTRFCYSFLSLHALSKAANHLQSLGRATITDERSRSEMQNHWAKLHADYSGQDKKKLLAIQTIIRDETFYSRIESMVTILHPIHSLLRVFDKSAPKACGWLFSALLHLRHVITNRIHTEFNKLSIVGIAEASSVLDERLRYIATPPVVLAFFLNPEAVEATRPELLQGFWKIRKEKSKAEETLDIASKFYEKVFISSSYSFRTQAEQEFTRFQQYCKESSPWQPHHEQELTSRFPIISALRSRLASSPMVSSTSERSFSTTRRIEAKDRNRLSEQTTEMLTLINSNMRSRLPKVPLSWNDIEKALYCENGSEEIDRLLAEVADNVPIEEDNVPESIVSEPSEDLLIRQLQNSPNSEHVDAPICLSSTSLDFISPFIDAESNPTALIYLGANLDQSISDSWEEEDDE